MHESILKLPSTTAAVETVKESVLSHTRSNVTLTNFPAAGVNLAECGFEKRGLGVRVTLPGSVSHPQPVISVKPVFELFDDFDIGQLIRGNETWCDLVNYRKNLRRPSLSFYGDKVALKRWLEAGAKDKNRSVSTARSLVVKCKSELVASENNNTMSMPGKPPSATSENNNTMSMPGKPPSAKNDLERQSQDQADLDLEMRKELKAIRKLLPRVQNANTPAMTGFVAKPTHRADGSGVWIVQCNHKTKKYMMQSIYEYLEDPIEYDVSKLARSMVRNLYKPPQKDESWALQQVEPGIILEEHFSGYTEKADDEEEDPSEFKVYLIWGRAWMVYWKKGGYRHGMLSRDGTCMMTEFGEGNDSYSESRDSDDDNDSDDENEEEEVPCQLPKWLNWNKVIEMAEELAKGKDMFRVDIFVGVPASSAPVSSKQEDREKTIQYVVSETAFHPTSKFPNDIVAEGARLWIAGYKTGVYKVVPNTEIPEGFQRMHRPTEEALTMQ